LSELSIFSIYVSHASDKLIKKFSDRHKNELGDKVYLINSSSIDIEQALFPDFEVINLGGNIGFAAANNVGISSGLKHEPDFFLIINPDVLLPDGWLISIKTYLLDEQYKDVGIFTVPLLGYDIAGDKPSGLIDSLGIDHTWYGRWFDVFQGRDRDVLSDDDQPYEVAAACGALMLIRRSVISELLADDAYVFNESYFMYKEDIELSVRVRALGKKIMMVPASKVFHCRGWAKDRAESPYWARKQSALNELRMHLKYYWRFLPYSFLKYFYVRFLETPALKLSKKVK